MGDAAVVLMHPLMVLVRGIGGGAIASATGAKARIGGAHRVEYSSHRLEGQRACRKAGQYASLKPTGIMFISS